MASATTQRNNRSAPPRLQVRKSVPAVSHATVPYNANAATRASDRLLDALFRYVRNEINEGELLPYIMESAEWVARGAVRTLPPFAHYEEVLSALNQRTVGILRKIDRTMDPLQIQKWIYRNFQGAVQDAGREADIIPIRKRKEINRWKHLCDEFTAEHGRDPTPKEQEELAAQVVPPRTLHVNGRTEIDMIMNVPKHVPMDVLSTASYEMEEDGRFDTEEMEQALHIAAANMEDDGLFASFVKLVVNGEITEDTIRADLAATLHDALLQLGVVNPAAGSDKVEDDLA